MKRWLPILVVCSSLGVGACNEAAGPGDPNDPDFTVYVLNSVGRTISRISVIDNRLETQAADVVLPANFDGAGMDVRGDLWVTTISAAGGSQVVFGSFSTGEQVITEFPTPPGALADPSKATLFVDVNSNIQASVATRGDNSTWVAVPGQSPAVPSGTDVGEFVERAIPFGQVLASIDANLDDEGGTFEPLGPPMIHLNNILTGALVESFELTGATGASDALVFQNEAAVLAGGSFIVNGSNFQPAGNGSVAIANVTARELITNLPLNGNGLSIEGGLNSLAYVTRTTGSDFASTDVLTVNLVTRNFDRGPTRPIEPTDASGARVNCWVATALTDSRLLCATLGFPGTLYLYDADVNLLDQITIGDGATDIAVLSG